LNKACERQAGVIGFSCTLVTAWTSASAMPSSRSAAWTPGAAGVVHPASRQAIGRLETVTARRIGGSFDTTRSQGTNYGGSR
jgi:hypothetical protein